MNLASLQQNFAQICDALLRKQHLIPSLYHIGSNSTIPRFRKALDVWYVSSHVCKTSSPMEARAKGNPLNFKIFIHAQQDIEVSGVRSCRNEAAPHENSA